MSLRSRLLVSLAVLGLVCAPSFADTSARRGAGGERAASSGAVDAERHAIAGKLFELGHTRAHVQNWQRSLAEQGMGAVCNDLTGEMRERVEAAWTSAVTRGFDIDAVMATMQQRLAAAASLPDLETQLVFETTPLGRRLNAISRAVAEEQSDAAAGQRRLAEGKRLVARDPVRARLVRRLLTALDIEEATLRVLSSVQLATTVGAIEATPSGKPRADMADVVEISGQYRDLVKAELSATLVPVYAQMWAALSVSDLEAYANHAEMPATQRVVRASLSIYDDLMRSAALAIGRAFSQELHAERL